MPQIIVSRILFFRGISVYARDFWDGKDTLIPIRRLQQGGLPLHPNYFGQITPITESVSPLIVSVALSRSTNYLAEDPAPLAKSEATLSFSCPDFPP